MNKRKFILIIPIVLLFIMVYQIIITQQKTDISKHVIDIDITGELKHSESEIVEYFNKNKNQKNLLTTLLLLNMKQQWMVY